MIYTFYSYKGGVGRSKALAEVAHCLARRGLRVLAIDFDLEAPGLEQHLFDGELPSGTLEHRGLIDLLRTYRHALTSDAAYERGDFKRWPDFILPVKEVAGSLGGSIHLMPAGQREPDMKSEYALAVRSFDWQDFFHNWKGDLFFDWLRRQLRDPANGFDVVLVDSRTGVTEMGGVCAYQLADAALLLCAANDQNLQGTVDVVRDFRSPAVGALRGNRPLEILAIPARLEEAHIDKEAFLDRFADQLGVDALPESLAKAGLRSPREAYSRLAVPYLREFAIGERLVDDRDKAIKAFEQLTDALVLLASEDSPVFRLRDDARARLRGESVAEAFELEADTSRATAGYDVFLDYGPADLQAARELFQALQSLGLAVFFDEAALAPGENWAESMTQALRQSQSLLVCFGRAGGASEWRERTLAEARRRESIRIVPVLLPGADDIMLRSFGLEHLLAVDLRKGPDFGTLGQLAEQLKVAKAPRASRAVTLTPERDPYPGAAPYQEDDAAFFFGREAETEAVLEALAHQTVVIVHGPAKVGKTSLVAAGVAPRLRQGADPQASTGEVVRVSRFDLESPAALAPLETLVAQHEGRVSDGNVDNPPAPGEYVIVDHIDSFTMGEELQVSTEQRADILARLIRQAGPHLKIILVVRDRRAEALGEALAQSGYLPHAIDIAPLHEEALRRAIEMPARRAGQLLEPGLVERLIESAGQARGAIFQIQLVLAALWPERRRGWLTNKMLDALGHLDGVFARHLQARLAELSPAERAAAQVLFINLLVLGNALLAKPERRPWSQVATVPSIAGAGALRLRDRLAAAGLIDLYRAAADESGLDEPDPLWLALVRPNPLLYLDQRELPDPKFLLWRGQFATYVRHWQTSGRHDDALLSGPVLDDAELWLPLRGDQLTDAERGLIEASLHRRRQQEDEAKERERATREQESLQLKTLAEAERQKAQAERERAEAADARAAAETARAEAEARERLAQQEAAAKLRKGWRQLLGALIAALLMLGAAGWALNEANDARRTAHSLRLAIEGQAMVGGARPGGDFRGMQQILAAHALAPEPEIYAIVLSVLQQPPRLRKIIPAEAPIAALAFSPDGSQLATVGVDGHLRLWDAQSGGALSQPIAAHTSGVQSVAFSPDGNRLATGGGDGKLRQWHTKSGAPLGQPITAHEGAVWSVAFSPDGSQLATGGGDGKLRLWDAQSGTALGQHIADDEKAWVSGWVASVAFSPDGSRLATGGRDGKLRLWDVKSGAALSQPIAAHEGGVPGDGDGGIASIVFSPDGIRLATGGVDGQLRLWDAKSDAALGQPIAAHEGGITSVAFSQDGSRLATGGEDDKLRLWDAKAGATLVQSIAANDSGLLGGGVLSLAFSPDGTWLATGGSDGKLRLWDTKSGAAFGPPIAAHEGGVGSLAYSPDGSRIATGGVDDQLRLWDAKDGTAFGPPIAALEGGVTSIAFSSDGSRLASGGRDGQLHLWDAKAGTTLGQSIAAHEGGVQSVAYSPDGSRLATGAEDGTLRLWDAKSGAALGPPIAADMGGVWSIAFSPDGSRLATGGMDGQLRLWDAKAGTALGQPIAAHEGGVRSVAFSPDGTRLATGGSDGTLLILPNVEGWPAELCSRLARNLNAQEWADWVGKDFSYRKPCPDLP